MARPGATNADVARLFLEAAELLELAGGNPFRIRAYRQGARGRRGPGRCGWVEQKDVANALPLTRLRKLLHGGRR